MKRLNSALRETKNHHIKPIFSIIIRTKLIIYGKPAKKHAKTPPKISEKGTPIDQKSFFRTRLYCSSRHIKENEKKEEKTCPHI